MGDKVRRRIATAVVAAILSSCNSHPAQLHGYWRGHPADPTIRLEPLPAPLQLTGSPDDQARSLAMMLESKTGATAALLTAALDSGFSIYQANGSVISGASPSQGIALEYWELEALAALDGAHGTIQIRDLEAVLASSSPNLNGASLASYISQGVRSRLGDARPTVRFWAQFINALSLTHPSGVDLSTNSMDSQSHLDVVQTLWIVRRLVGDMATANPKVRTTVRSLGGSPTPSAASNLLIKDALAADAIPCHVNDTAATILDWSAALEGHAFDGFVEYLKANGFEAIEKYASVVGALNTLAAYGTLLLALLEVTGKIDMKGAPDDEPAPPLIRTKNTHDNHYAVLTGSVHIDVGNGQLLNCLRLALNQLGLDVSVPNDGALPNTRVQWLITKGGASGGVSSPATIGIVGFNGDPEDQSTSASGETTIGIHGVHQKVDLEETGYKLAEFRRQAQVALDTSVTSASLVQAVAGAGSVISMPATLLTNARVFRAATKDFTVIDWAPDLELSIDGTAHLIGATLGFGCVRTYTGVAQARQIRLSWMEDERGVHLVGDGTVLFHDTVFDAGAAKCEYAGGHEADAPSAALHIQFDLGGPDGRDPNIAHLSIQRVFEPTHGIEEVNLLLLGQTDPFGSDASVTRMAFANGQDSWTISNWSTPDPSAPFDISVTYNKSVDGGCLGDPVDACDIKARFSVQAIRQ